MAKKLTVLIFYQIVMLLISSSGKINKPVKFFELIA